MWRTAREEVVGCSATFLAIVVSPDPAPPAIPIIRGFSIPLQRYDAHDWNALCPRREYSHRFSFSSLCHENTIDRLRAFFRHRHRVQYFRAWLCHHGPESADGRGSGQPGFSGHGRVRRALRAAFATRARYGNPQNQFYYPAKRGEWSHDPSVYRRPYRWQTSVREPGDIRGAGRHGGYDDPGSLGRSVAAPRD